jgi:hypothetical protein
MSPNLFQALLTIILLSFYFNVRCAKRELRRPCFKTHSESMTWNQQHVGSGRNGDA